MSSLRRIAATLGGILVVLGLGIAPVGASTPRLTNDQRALLQQLSVRNFGSVVVDSAMTYEQAMGDNVVPAEGRAIHTVMKPYLRVVPVAYWGLNSNGPDGRIHVGQIVVHKLLVEDTNKVFWRMFQLGFPIHSVIPESAFGYDDQASMAADNSSNYRPEDGSEHGRAAAFDINTFENPFDITGYDPSVPVQPAGATYDPSQPGTIVMDSDVRRAWTNLGWQWGGNWGNPDADPPYDFYLEGYFDYQHFQLNVYTYDAFVEQLPKCMQHWNCKAS